MQTDKAPKVASLYNRYLIDLILQAKNNINKDVTTILKKQLKATGHSAIEPGSISHIAHAASTLDVRGILECQDPVSALSDPRITETFEPLAGVPFKFLIWDPTSSDLASHLIVLATLATTFARDADDGPLSNNVVAVLGAVQEGKAKGDGIESSLDGILDDDISLLLDKLADLVDTSHEPEPEPDRKSVDDNSLLQLLQNSKIGALASEITKDLGEGFSVDNMANMTDGNMLGTIVSKVGSKIQGKLSNGELKHEDLMNEAMGFLKAVGPALGGSTAGGGGGIEAMLSNIVNAASNSSGKPVPDAIQSIMKDAMKDGGIENLLSGLGNMSELAGLAGIAGLGKPEANKTHSAEQRRKRLQQKLRDARKLPGISNDA